MGKEFDYTKPDEYVQSFAILYDAWHEDYPALEKIYLFQIRNGCFMTGAGVREVRASDTPQRAHPCAPRSRREIAGRDDA